MAASIPKGASSVREQVTAEEWQVRIDLAAAYRLVAANGWDDLIFTHISARVPGEEEHFLVNPYGLLFEEITASSLVKVDLEGRIAMDTAYAINPAGFTIHSAVHEAREDAGCVMHLHTNAGIAVSAQAAGLLPISQTALFPASDLAYHDYEGVALNADEKLRLVADLGARNFLILRNHGTLTVGRTVAEAYLAMHVLERACEIQIKAQSGSGELIRVPEPIVEGIQAQASKVTLGQGGQLAWPAMLRKAERLDPGFRD